MNANAQAEQPALLPPVDVIEDACGITLFADLPGVSREKLSLQVDADTLIIEAEMDLPMPPQLESTHAEVSIGRYRRVFRLSKELDTARLNAELKHGVLKLHIQKADRAKPRKIKVQAA